MYNLIDIMNYIEINAPLNYAEDYDNVGLIIGDKKLKVKKVLLCLDITPDVVNGAIKNKVDLIISHHPLIFKGIKRLLYSNINSKMIIDLIKNDISVYSAHTNLDLAQNGLNNYLAKKIKLKNIKKSGNYKYENLYKVTIFVPQSHVEEVKKVLGECGAGHVGKYSDCTFSTAGEGAFRPLEGTKPYIGNQGEITKLKEYRIETVIEKYKLDELINSVKKVHPYEEMAYDIYKLENKYNSIGFGFNGELDKEIDLIDYINIIKEELDLPNLRYIGDVNKKVKKVAVFCGSIDTRTLSYIDKNTDLLVSGEIKHHMAIDLKYSGFSVIDIGHFGSEKIVVELLKDLLLARFNEIEIVENIFEEDPIKVF